MISESAFVCGFRVSKFNVCFVRVCVELELFVLAPIELWISLFA